MVLTCVTIFSGVSTLLLIGLISLRTIDSIVALLFAVYVGGLALVIAVVSLLIGLFRRDKSLGRTMLFTSATAVFFMTQISAARTYWPLGLVFHHYKKAIDALGDKVEKGEKFPHGARVGPFHFVACENRKGCAFLMFDDNPAGPDGFIRVRDHRPFLNPWFINQIGSDWFYYEED